MIFRLSQKLSAKIKAGALPSVPLDEEPLADWSAHRFVAGYTQYLLLSNTKSLYSTVMYGRGVTTRSRFIECALDGLRDFMEADGLDLVFDRFIVPFAASIEFARSLDRSVTGSMSEMIKHATFWLTEDDRSRLEVCFLLNETPMSALASGRLRYIQPREAFRALADGVEE